MDKELQGLVTGSDGESEAWSKKNNNLFEMDSDKESDEEDEHGTNYNLWSEEQTNHYINKHAIYEKFNSTPYIVIGYKQCNGSSKGSRHKW